MVNEKLYFYDSILHLKIKKLIKKIQMLVFPKDLKNIGKNCLQTSLFTLCKYEKNHISKNQEVFFEDYTLVFIIKGHKKIYTHDNHVDIKENEVVFFTKNSFSIRDYLDDTMMYQSIIFSFKESVLIEFIHKYKEFIQKIITIKKSKSFFAIKTDILVKNAFLSLLIYIENKQKNNEILLKLKLEELFLSLLYSEDNDEFLAFIKEILNGFSLDLYKIFSYCKDEFESVAQMAKFSKMDIASFSRNFKQSFGISAKEWLDNKRFEKAKFLLEFSTKNVTQICLELGFNSPAWFIARYKKRYGITPKQEQKSKKLYFLS
ncbi:helix-turn-helix transcriptional regulator [Campylobacter volucris]|uniref:AraC family transcriptional regulator n=4 Tax=Campylobacter volucris TaxID=1031542 RepID=A0AAE6CZD8_9BACT|nr:AraC family transcriptional regulator [Campylobacter volucris]KAB0579551.1 helix-turn-helix transcriptional regulator [Campylobacter volucris]QBL14139.1 AraC family transcriptional regulator [Campylobacter volucris]TXK66483.1 helix-turn-helix transcriptional regulator [Campylobacter volucris]